MVESLRPVALAILLLTTVPAGAREEPPATKLAEQIDEIMAEWNRPGSPGCAVGVVRDGDLAFARGYGYANLDHDIPITPDTVFDIGSTSKQFTTVAVTLLAERGVLSLDDDVRRHVPEMPDYGRPITIRHLIHHTSGIRDYLTVMALAGLEYENVYTLDDVVKLIARQRGLNFEPGAEHLYSNSGYILLAAVAERVAGKPLGVFLREEVFAPLGMYDTRVYDDRHLVIPRRATGYSRNDDRLVVDHVYNFEVPGDGQIYTTVKDLARWDRVFYSDELGGEGFVERLHTHGVLNDGSEISYAFGLGVGEFRGLKTVRHGGAWGGFRAELLRFPDERTSVICLCNYGEIDPSATANRLAEAVLGDRMEAVATAPEEAAAAATATLTAEALGAFEGAFKSRSMGNVWQFAVVDGELTFTSFMSGRTFRLAPTGPRDFRVVEPPREFTVHFEDDGRLRVAEPGEDDDFFDPVEIADPGAGAAAYAGDFYSEELDATHQLRVDGEKLVFERPRAEPVTLKPGPRDVFFAGFLRLTFARGDGGAVTGFEVDAGRVRGIRFERVAAVVPAP